NPANSIIAPATQATDRGSIQPRPRRSTSRPKKGCMKPLTRDLTETRVPARARLSPVSRTRKGRMGGIMLRRKSMATWEKDSKNKCTSGPLFRDVNDREQEDQP